MSISGHKWQNRAYSLVGNGHKQKIVAFDSFGKFPDTEYVPDKPHREKFIGEAGDESISQYDLMEVLGRKNCEHNLELVAGDICKTVPRYLEENPNLQIALLNLDVDLYEPSVTILEYLYPRVSKGGILILDDYGSFPGETRAADDYFTKKWLDTNLRELPYDMATRYLVA